MIVKVRGDEKSSWFIFENAEDIYLVENFSGFEGLNSDHITPEHQLDVYKEIIANQLNNSYIEFSKSKRRYGILFDTTAFLMNDNGETIERIRSNSPSNSFNFKEQNSSITWHENEGPPESGDEESEQDEIEEDDFPLHPRWRNLGKDPDEGDDLSKRLQQLAGITEDNNEESEPIQKIVDNSDSRELKTFAKLVDSIGKLDREIRKRIDVNEIFEGFAESSVRTIEDLDEWVQEKEEIFPEEIDIKQAFDEDPSELVEEAFADEFDIDQHFKYGKPSENEENKTKRVEFEQST